MEGFCNMRFSLTYWEYAKMSLNFLLERLSVARKFPQIFGRFVREFIESSCFFQMLPSSVSLGNFHCKQYIDRQLYRSETNFPLIFILSVSCRNESVKLIYSLVGSFRYKNEGCRERCRINGFLADFDARFIFRFSCIFTLNLLIGESWRHYILFYKKIFNILYVFNDEQSMVK